MNIAVVQGTRPEIIKNYAVVKALRAAEVPFTVFHTNQHVLQKMRDDVYADMGYQAHEMMPAAFSVGSAIDWLQACFARLSITHVVVNGDTSTALVAAIAAMHSGIELSHIEAGLRARDNVMLEERNRIMVDSIASHLFAYTDFERDILVASPDVRGKVYVEGNTTVDMLVDFQHRIEQQNTHGRYVYATLHRQELTKSPERLGLVLDALSSINRDICKVIFAVHPRTLNAINEYGFNSKLVGICTTPPQSIFECLSMQANAGAVLTDSGCIQEEAYMLGVPCVTIRENTERHLTVMHGANRLTGFDKRKIIRMCIAAIQEENNAWPEIYGSYGVGERIVARILGAHQPESQSETTELSCLNIAGA